MNMKSSSLIAAALMFGAAAAQAQVTLYADEGFRGQVYRTSGSVGNLDRVGFNDRASSVVVERGEWQVCDDSRFNGRCVVLRAGSYPSLRSLGLNDRVSSLRPASYGGDWARPEPAPIYEYRRRPNERLFEARVTDVRAIYGAPERRCWVERGQASASGDNVGGAIAGAIIGGILGHQIGGGRGQDIATAGGAVAGAAIGSGAGNSYGRDYRRCETSVAGAPAYWDVTYRFRSVEHRTQMASPPGSTITVNGNGVPRG